MTPAELQRFAAAMVAAVEAGNLALHRWGIHAQLDMVQEECGELVATINRGRRGRVSATDIIDESADVLITAAQAGLALGRAEVGFSLTDLCEAIERKTKRLRERLEGSTS